MLIRKWRQSLQLQSDARDPGNHLLLSAPERLSTSLDTHRRHMSLWAGVPETWETAEQLHCGNQEGPSTCPLGGPSSLCHVLCSLLLIVPMVWE